MTTFLERLRGVTDPEEKRHRIGEEFIKVFEDEATRLGKVDFLVSGNRDLLNLANTFTCPIVSAEVFPDSHL